MQRAYGNHKVFFAVMSNVQVESVFLLDMVPVLTQITLILKKY